MRFASICSGIGVAESAWEQLGWKPVFVSEIEPFPSAVLKTLYPNVPNLGDMTTIKGDEWFGKIDLLAGGTPCQAFSIAGNRKSLADERGNLTLKFVELCDAIQPAFIVWENVPGVLSTSDNAFGCFLSGLAGESFPAEPGPRPKMGKNSQFWRWDNDVRQHIPKWPASGWIAGPKRAVAWRVLDAQYFGVAQRRRRVFLVACPRSGADPRTILFESDSVRRDTPPSREAGQTVAGTISSCSFTGGASGRPEGASGNHFITTYDRQSSGEYGESGISSTVQARDYKGATDLVVCQPLTISPYSDNAAEEGKLVIDFQQIKLGELRAGDVSGTLNTNSNPNVRNTPTVQYWMQVRRLTPRECERLQGLPDDYTLVPVKKVKTARISSPKVNADSVKRYVEINGDVWQLASDGPRYKAIGNAWNRAVVEWLGKRIDSYVKSEITT